jgi:hypothetical protein
VCSGAKALWKKEWLSYAAPYQSMQDHEAAG